MIEQMEQLEERINHLCNTVNEARRRNAELESSNQALQDELNESQARVEGLESEKNEMSEQLEQVTTQSGEQNNREEVIKNKLVNLIDKLDSVESELSELKQEEVS